MAQSQNPYTSISVSRKMRDELAILKRGGETYDDLLERLIDFEAHEDMLEMAQDEAEEVDG